MKNTLYIFIFIFFININAQTPKTYYISDSHSAASDSNNGDDTNLPWKTAMNLNRNNFFNPGDKILFRRGDKWMNQYFTMRSSGISGNPIVIGSYGGFGARPIISGVSNLNETFNQSTSTLSFERIRDDLNIWAVESPVYPARLFIDHNSNNEIDTGDEELLKGWDTRAGVDPTVTNNRFNLGYPTYSMTDSSCNNPMVNGNGEVILDRWYWGKKFIMRENDTIYPPCPIPPNPGQPCTSYVKYYLFIYSDVDPNNLNILRVGNSHLGNYANNYYRNLYNIHIDSQHDIIIENLDLQGGETTILIGSTFEDNTEPVTTNFSSNIIIRNCNLGTYSSSAIEIMRAENIQIYDNIIDSKYNLKYGLSQENCLKFYETLMTHPDENSIKNPNQHYFSGSDRGTSDAIELSRYAINCNIYDNTIKDFSHAGVQLNCMGNNCIKVTNNKIHGNTISGNNISYSRGFTVFGEDNKTKENEIYNNLIKNTSVQSQIAGTNNLIHHNIFHNITQSDLRPKGYSVGINVRPTMNGLTATGNKFDNNLFINCDDAGFSIAETSDISSLPLDEVTNIFFRNNIIYNCGNSQTGYIGLNIQSFGNIDTGTITVHNNIYKNNLIYSGFNNNTIKYHDNTYTVAEFNDIITNNNSIIHGNDIVDNINPDPNFIDLTVNYKLNDNNSPCRNNGTIDVILDGTNNILDDFNRFDYFNTSFPNELADIGVEEIKPTVSRLIESKCNAELTADNTIVEWYLIPNTTEYEVQFINSNGETLVLPNINFPSTINSTSIDISNYYSEDFFNQYQWYGVKIRQFKDIDGIENSYGFSNFGGHCNIRVPKTTFLINEDCNRDLTLNNSTISCYLLPKINNNIDYNYIFKFTNSIGGSYWITTSINSIDLLSYIGINSNNFLTYNNSYNVQVRKGGSYDSDSNCSITTPNILINTGKSINNENIQSIPLFPNPFNKYINFPSFNSDITITITDTTGKILIHKLIPKKQKKLNLKHLLKGIYYISINNGKNIFYQKIIKN